MSIAMFAQVFGTGLKMYAAQGAATDVKNAAAYDKYQNDLQRQNNKIQAQEKSIQRTAQFESAQATNEAFFGFLNRDVSDVSLKAFQRRQKEILAEDISAIESNAFVADRQLKAQSDMRTYEARVAARDYKMQAVSSLASGLYKYNVSKS
jgi:hypothetical protein